MEIKFKKAPGLIYDVLAMLILKLNPQKTWVSTAINTNHENEDMIYFKYWMSQFEDPDSRLLLFFYRKDPRTLSFLVNLYKDLLDKYGFNIDFETLINELNDPEYLFSQVTYFYFGEEIPSSIPFDQLSEKIYYCETVPDDIKFHILNFIINKPLYLNSLIEWLTKYYTFIEELYDMNAKDIIELQEHLQLEELKMCSDLYFDRNPASSHERWNSINTIYTSFSLILKNTVWIHLLSNYAWCILGKDYQTTLRVDINHTIDPISIGNAIGDAIRQRIIQLLLKFSELSCSEISKRAHISLSSATYHLDIMKKSNLLSSRNVGKSVIYWINTKTCEAAAQMFINWSKGDFINEKLEKTEYPNCI